MKLKREKNKIKKKLFWLKTVIGFLPFCFTCAIPNSFIFSNTSNVEKTNISDVFDTLPTWENLHSDPSNDEVLTYLNKYLVNSNKSRYSSVINEILITKIENGLVNIVTKPDSREYTGSYEFHYSFYNKIDLSTLLNGVNIDPPGYWTYVPSARQILLRIHQKIPSIDINQLTVNTNDIFFDSGGYYQTNIVADSESNLYFGTGTVRFGLVADKHFIGLGLSIWYSSTIISEGPTLDGNQIILNKNGWYCIDGVDNSDTYLDRNITTADNSTIRIYIDQPSIWNPVGTNAFTIGENSTLNLSTSANLSISSARDDKATVRFAPAGIRVPYSSSLILTGKTGANFLVKGADGRTAAAGIGGDGATYATKYGPEDRTTSNLSCGSVTLLGGLSMDIYGGDITVVDCGGGSAGIGGAGCNNGWAGDCKSVSINTTGICNIYGGGVYNNERNVFATPGCAIGGGSCGSANEPSDYNYVYKAGSLEQITINSGYINCVSKSTSGHSRGAASTIGGGGTCGFWDNKDKPLYLAGGDLGSFEISGGLLVVNATSGDYISISNQISSAIGGGGVGVFNGNMPSDLVSASTCSIGNMNSFILNGGNIYVSNGSHRSKQQGLHTSTYGRAGRWFSVAGVPTTYGTQSTFQINNGSLFQDEVFEVGINTFSMHPTNSNNQSLYPCLVPSTINGVSTIGKTLTIPSINYSCNLENLAEYNSSCEASGCLWLPIGNYTDIMIDGISYYAIVNGLDNPTTTRNIVRR